MKERIEGGTAVPPEPGGEPAAPDTATPGADGRAAAGGDLAVPNPHPDGPGGASAAAEPEWTAAGPEAEAFSRRVAAARERTPDFDAVALNPDLPVTTAMAATIALSERGPEIAYHLGCNPGLAARIAALDPLSAARELGRIEAQLTAAPKRAVTAAPPPLRSLGAGETPRRDPDAMSYQEYKAWRRTG